MSGHVENRGFVRYADAAGRAQSSDPPVVDQNRLAVPCFGPRPVDDGHVGQGHNRGCRVDVFPHGTGQLIGRLGRERCHRSSERDHNRRGPENVGAS